MFNLSPKTYSLCKLLLLAIIALEGLVFTIFFVLHFNGININTNQVHTDTTKNETLDISRCKSIEKTFIASVPPKNQDKITPSKFDLDFKKFIPDMLKPKLPDSIEHINELKKTLDDIAAKPRVTPNWNCNLYECNGKNAYTYPPSQKIVNSLSGLPQFDIGAKKESIDMIVIFDINCPNCSIFYNKTLEKLISNNYRIKLIPGANQPLSALNENKLKRQSRIMCGKNKEEEIHYLIRNRIVEQYTGKCTKEVVLKVLQKTKNALHPYGFDTATPIVFTKKAVIAGGKDFDTIKKYL